MTRLYYGHLGHTLIAECGKCGEGTGVHPLCLVEPIISEPTFKVTCPECGRITHIDAYGH